MMKKQYIAPTVICNEITIQYNLLSDSHIEIVNGDNEKSQRPDNNPDDFEVGAKKNNVWESWDEF